MSELEKEGFRMVSSRAEAKLLKTFRDEKGRMRIKDQLIVGNPKYVRGVASPSHDKEDVKVEYAQTFNTYVREKKTETTEGIVKEREYVEEQKLGINGKDDEDTDQTFENESDSDYHQKPNNDPSPLQVLKNFVDKLADGQNTMWIVIVAIAILAGAGLIISLMR
jgi:GH18 family chitinase